jgi:transposase
MSLKPLPVPPVPENTAKIARAAFRKGNLYMKMRDEFGSLFTDEQFAKLFSHRGQPALAPWRLALITLMQFVENLPDRQAADMVRSRLDWKYALGLELDDAGFDASVLCEFRKRLVEGEAETELFETLLSAFAERKLLKTRGTQRTDSTHVLLAVRGLNRLETIGETLRHALNSLAEIAPEWLSACAPEPWFDRYSKRMEAYRLPKDQAQRDTLAQTMGEDGLLLLSLLAQQQAPPALATLPAVQTLRWVWIQQFLWEGDQVRMRDEKNMPPSTLILRSPYELEARLAKKRDMNWTGYKVHLTETCDEDTPHLITDVLTTEATLADTEVMPLIQEALEKADRLPEEHVVDEGYTATPHFLASSNRQIQLIGPIKADTSWQHTAGKGFDHTGFEIDWDRQQARCPAGKLSKRWKPQLNAFGVWYVQVGFSTPECQACALKPDCTHSKTYRSIHLHPQEEYEAMLALREQQKSLDFRKRYAVRAGIEGTLSQGIRDHGMRTARYIGKTKTRLQHLIVAAAINFCRVFDWLTGTPLAKTRRSHFARLRPATVQ